MKHCVLRTSCDLTLLEGFYFILPLTDKTLGREGEGLSNTQHSWDEYYDILPAVELDNLLQSMYHL
jgi:hypothetical protein